MLVEARRLTPLQMEEALKNQAIFGGRLGTNLIEMGFLEEDEVAEFLSRKMGLPCVPSDQLMSVPPEVIRLIPKELAVKYHIIPIAIEKKRLSLAMLDPSDLPLMDEISFVTGYVIIPLIATEMRMTLALEKHYGLKPNTRFVQYAERIKVRKETEKSARVAERPAKRVEHPHHGKEARKEIVDAIEEILSAQGITMTEPPRPEPKEEELADASSMIIEPIAVHQVREDAFEPAPGKAETVQPPHLETEQPLSAPSPHEDTISSAMEPKQESIKEKAKTAEELAERLAETRDREDIADQLVSCLGEEFDRVALFMIKGNVAVGWRGLHGKAPIPSLDELRIPLERPSILKTVTDGKSFYLGSIPETPENSKMMAGIGGNTPSSVLLLPLMLMGRAVSVIYVEGGFTPLSNRIAHLQKIVGKASMAFEILILKNKILMT
jgi:hypothetical protein